MEVSICLMACLVSVIIFGFPLSKCMRANNLTSNHSITFKGKDKATNRYRKKSPGLASSQEIGARLIVDMSIGDNTLEYAMTAATTLQQRHKELKEMRVMERFSEVYSSSPSDFDTSYNESTWHCPMQPLPTK